VGSSTARRAAERAVGLPLAATEASVRAEALRQWEQHLHVGGYAPTSVATYLRAVAAIVPTTSLLLSPQSLEGILASRLGRGRARGTVHQYQHAVRSFYAFLLEPAYGWPQYLRFRYAAPLVMPVMTSARMLTTPAQRVDNHPRSVPRTTMLGFIAAVADVGMALRRDCDERWWHHVVTATALGVGYAFGLRVSEICGLDCEDLYADPAGALADGCGIVHVRNGKASHRRGKQERWVPLLPEMRFIVPMLRTWAEEVRPHVSPPDEHALFVDSRGRRLSTQALEKRVKMLRTAFGLPRGFVVHSGRHGFVTDLAMCAHNEYDSTLRQRLSGHRFAQTQAIYEHVPEAHHRAAIARAWRISIGDSDAA
jgi:integrase/recombinase XerC